MQTHTISTKGNLLHYHREQLGTRYDASWSLEVDSIVVVGGIARMVGDEDRDFLAFIDSTGTKFFMHLANEPDGLDAFSNLFQRKFGCDPIHWSHGIYDSSQVLFPTALAGRKLYQGSFRKAVRVGLAIDYPADGELTVEVMNYIQRGIAPGTSEH